MIHIILQNEVAAWTFGIGGFALAGYLFMLNKKVGKIASWMDQSHGKKIPKQYDS